MKDSITPNLVQCNRNIATHNAPDREYCDGKYRDRQRNNSQSSTACAEPVRTQSDLESSRLQRFGVAASLAALLVLSPSSLACSVNTCICFRI